MVADPPEMATTASSPCGERYPAMSDEAAPARPIPGVTAPRRRHRRTFPSQAQSSAAAAKPAGTVLRFRAGSVLLVAGIPGAGKSTLIRRLFGTAPADVLVLDSADIRAALARWLGERMPYRFYRPLVHTVHYARIAAWTLGPCRNLVVHECGTRDWARRTLAALARARRRPAHLLLLDTAPEAALAGQRSRGRMVRTTSFVRHSRQQMLLERAVDAMAAADAGAAAPPASGSGPACAGAARAGRRTARAPDLQREGWTSARRLGRDEAAALRAIDFDR